MIQDDQRTALIMSTESATVYIIDDDPAMRKMLVQLIESVNYTAASYPSAEEFLEDYEPGKPACLVLDVRMPGMGGIALHRQLMDEGDSIPVLFISAFGDVSMASNAVRSGAVDFIEKPFHTQTLLGRIREALNKDNLLRQERRQKVSVEMMIRELTSRELEIAELLVTGMSVKEVAIELGVSHKTVHVHRAHILEKLKLDSVVGLTRMFLSIGRDLGNDHDQQQTYTA